MKREFNAIISKAPEGYFIAEVPELEACFAQGDSIDELMDNLNEVIEFCLEEDGNVARSEFVVVQKRAA